MAASPTSFEIPRIEWTAMPNRFDVACDCGWIRVATSVAEANLARRDHALRHAGFPDAELTSRARAALAGDVGFPIDDDPSSSPALVNARMAPPRRPGPPSRTGLNV